MLETIARNMWIAPRRNQCEYFDDILDLIDNWEKTDKSQLLEAKNFIEELKKSHPRVYEYVRTYYHES
jgi:hypothetical protein